MPNENFPPDALVVIKPITRQASYDDRMLSQLQLEGLQGETQGTLEMWRLAAVQQGCTISDIENPTGFGIHGPSESISGLAKDLEKNGAGYVVRVSNQ